jgi:hypothetical protein
MSAARAARARDVTYNDLEFVLDRMSKVNEWNERAFDRPAGTRPGFLVAFTELMDKGVRAWSRAGGTKFEYAPQSLFYIHRAKPCELRKSGVKLLHDVTVGGRMYSRLLEGEFCAQSGHELPESLLGCLWSGR